MVTIRRLSASLEKGAGSIPVTAFFRNLVTADCLAIAALIKFSISRKKKKFGQFSIVFPCNNPFGFRYKLPKVIADKKGVTGGDLRFFFF